jgi:hypothetical protein
MNDVSFLEADAEFSAGHVGIVFGIVINVGLDVHHGLLGSVVGARGSLLSTIT